MEYVRSAYSVFRTLFFLTIALGLGLWLGHLVPSTHPWRLDDLRALDPADAPPAADLTALYTRTAGLDCEIRLDYLDLPPEPQYYLELELGERKTILSSLSPLPADASVDYHPVIDTLTVTLKNCSPFPGTPLTVRALPSPMADLVSDQIGPIAFDAPPPKERIAINFVFYNTFFPAATPLQALRRWDGAHTGPLGERHGLHNLLNAAEKYKIPLTLLDLKTPAALSAIDYLGGMAQIRRMEQAGLLEMPAVILGKPEDVSLAFSRSVARNFGLLPGDSVFDITSPPLLPLFNWPDIALSRNGLPLSFRRKLLMAATVTRVPLILGGDFQTTTWGTPEYLNPAFAYLAARPYIEFVDAFNLPSGGSGVKLPPNPIQLSALETQFTLNAFTADGALSALRKNYSGLVDSLFAAAAWSENPTARAECKDLCVLSSDRFYALLDPAGGRLVFFFAGSEQVIGPMAQFFVGFSDSSLWDSSKGQGADPAQVMGAFADADEPFGAYTPVVLDEKTIHFTAANGRVKTYRLTDSGLQVELSGVGETQIPLVLNPQSRFESDWAGLYHFSSLPRGEGLGVRAESGPLVRIQSSGSAVLAWDSFLAGIPFGASPENPNAEVPAGMVLPFPMLVARLSGFSDQTVIITVSDK